MKKWIKKKESESKGFTLRGLENTRIESLSDGVFAIAIGLLLISADAPSTFEELKIFSKEFIPFAFTISLLMYIWYQHYLFFIRYGLRGPLTITLNTVLLFLILYYVYPLKFLFVVLVGSYTALITGNRGMANELFTETIRMEDTGELMLIYGLGAAAVFIVLALLNYLALRKREELNLTKIEVVLTENTIRHNVVSASIPFLSAIIAGTHLAGSYTFMLSGMIYMLYGVAMPLSAIKGAKKLEAITKD